MSLQYFNYFCHSQIGKKMKLKKFKRHIPSLLTSLNLFAGSAALFLASEGKGLLIYGAYFILVSAFFDFFEDYVIRRSHTHTDVGKELASLADLVSFGVAPAAIMYKLLKVSLKVDAFSLDLPVTSILILLSPVLIVMFSAWRLAKFNVERKIQNNYLGMPTPTFAILVASLPMVLDFTGKFLLVEEWNFEFWFILPIIGLTLAIGNSLFLLIITFFSIFLIIRFPMFSFRFRGQRLRENIIRGLFLLIAAVGISVFQPAAVPVVVLLFIILSLINNLIAKIKKEPILVMEKVSAKNADI